MSSFVPNEKSQALLEANGTRSTIIDIEPNEVNNINRARRSDRKRQSFKSRINSKLKAHDPTARNVYVTCSTLKYATIAFITLCLCFFSIFIFIIGVFTLDKCKINEHLPVYLLVSGLVSLIRIFLCYTCAYDFSRSLLAKMYEHLVWRLCINRAKWAYYCSLDKSMKSNFDLANQNENRHSLNYDSNLFRFKKCSFILNFVWIFFCCDCLCVKHLMKKCCRDKIENSKHLQLSSSHKSHSETSYLCTNAAKDSFSNQSSSNLSDLTPENSSLTYTNILKDLACLNIVDILENKTLNREKINQVTFIDERVIRSSASKASRSRLANKTKSSNGDRRFHRGHASNVAHQCLQKHFNRTHRPIRLLDARTIRYGLSNLLQRIIDLFLLIWFAFGNYWVFGTMQTSSSGHDDNANSFALLNKTMNASSSLNMRLSPTISRVFNVHNIKSRENSTLCLDVAFFQIVSTYFTFLVLVVLIVSLQVNSIFGSKNNEARRESRSFKNRMHIRRSNSLPSKFSKNSRDR